MPTETVQANDLAASYFRLIDPRYDLYCRRFLDALQAKNMELLSAFEQEAFALVELHALPALDHFDLAWKVAPDRSGVEKARLQLSRGSTVLLDVSITQEALEAEIAARKHDGMEVPSALSEALNAFKPPEGKQAGPMRRDA